MKPAQRLSFHPEASFKDSFKKFETFFHILGSAGYGKIKIKT